MEVPASNVVCYLAGANVALSISMTIFSTISATIEINKYNGKYYVMSSHGRDFTKKNPLEWAKKT